MCSPYFVILFTSMTSVTICWYILDIFMIIIETQNRPNWNIGIQNGRKHHIQMIFFIENKTLCKPNT